LFSVTPSNLPITKIQGLLHQEMKLVEKKQKPLNGRRAAVLVPLVIIDSEWHLLYTRRSETVNDHKGQVSFPGGSIEVYDPDPELAAIREAREEIGLLPHEVEILGRMQDYLTVSKFNITPVVANIKWPSALNINADEVSHVFTIPLSWLRTAGNFEYRSWQTPSGYFEKVIFFKEYQGECLWGISARITVNLLDLLGLLEEG